jgi:hypothetical protein
LANAQAALDQRNQAAGQPQLVEWLATAEDALAAAHRLMGEAVAMAAGAAAECVARLAALRSAAVAYVPVLADPEADGAEPLIGFWAAELADTAALLGLPPPVDPNRRRELKSLLEKLDEWLQAIGEFLRDKEKLKKVSEALDELALRLAVLGLLATPTGLGEAFDVADWLVQLLKTAVDVLRIVDGDQGAWGDFDWDLAGLATLGFARLLKAAVHVRLFQKAAHDLGDGKALAKDAAAAKGEAEHLLERLNAKGGPDALVKKFNDLVDSLGRAPTKVWPTVRALSHVAEELNWTKVGRELAAELKDSIRRLEQFDIAPPPGRIRPPQDVVAFNRLARQVLRYANADRDADMLIEKLAEQKALLREAEELTVHDLATALRVAAGLDDLGDAAAAVLDPSLDRPLVLRVVAISAAEVGFEEFAHFRGEWGPWASTQAGQLAGLVNEHVVKPLSQVLTFPARQVGHVLTDPPPPGPRPAPTPGPDPALHSG